MSDMVKMKWPRRGKDYVCGEFRITQMAWHPDWLLMRGKTGIDHGSLREMKDRAARMMTRETGRIHK